MLRLGTWWWAAAAGWAATPPRAVVATPLYERFVPTDKLDETLHSFYGFHPLGRVGTARDLANTITFLLPGHQLGDRRDLERRRRRHGRTQLTTPPARAPAPPPGARAGPQPRKRPTWRALAMVQRPRSGVRPTWHRAAKCRQAGNEPDM